MDKLPKTVSAYNVAARGIFRDSEGRIAGTSEQQLIERIEPGKAAFVVINSPVDESPAIRSDPFKLINGPGYSIDLQVGVPGPPIMDGCEFGLPWD